MKSIGNTGYRIIERITYVAGYASGWLVLVMMILVVFEVFMRYVLKRPPMIADEFSGYLLVLISYLGTAYAMKEGGHVRVTFLVEKLSKKTSRRFRLITLTGALLFAIIMSKASYNLAAFSVNLNMRSSTWLRFPLKWPQMSLMIGFILLSLMIIVLIAKAIKEIKSGD